LYERLYKLIKHLYTGNSATSYAEYIVFNCSASLCQSPYPALDSGIVNNIVAS